MHLTVFGRESDVARSPRNHWWNLEQIFEDLANNRTFSAWKGLEAIRYSNVLPAQVVSDVSVLICQQWTQPGVPLERPCDYLRLTSNGRAGLPVMRTLKPQNLPPRYPFEMMLPDITGSANDIAFLGDVLGRPEFTGPAPRLRLRLVTQVASPADLLVLKKGLAARDADGGQLDGLSAVIFMPEYLAPVPLPVPATWHNGNPWHLDGPTQKAVLAGDAEILLFLPPHALEDAFLIERVRRYMALSGNLCLMLEPMNPSTPEMEKKSVLSDSALHRLWGARHTAFRSLDRLAFAISARRFCELGGFDARFETEFFACREIAFRLYNKGSYFVPLTYRTTDEIIAPRPKASADASLLVQLCPHPWDRKSDGRFQVPKVSVYIPAFRAARYLREAIDSVLDQDFEDLEVCVADDGSPDDTLRVLEQYASGPRVKWQTGVNGGIGHASNRAIRMTRGIYVGQLDSDDRLKPGAIRRLAEYLDENPKVGCVYGSCERIGPSGTHLRNEYSWPTFSREKMMLTSIAHHFRMFRRQTWERTEGFREDIVNGVDYDLFLKMSEVAQFRHIDEIMYQRRWHGDNTSQVNEAFQTANTYRVQREALKRLGMDRAWDVHVPDPEQPREVTYRRIGNRHRVIFWPDYSRANPYQRLLYQKAQERCEIMGGDIEAALQAIRQVGPEDSPNVTFHLHWLNRLLNDAKSLGEASDRAQAFLSKLREFKFCGGRLVWTIHNTLSHDLPFPQVERSLAREIVALADAVHVHCVESVPEIEKFFPIPRDKLQVHRHGAYVGTYPDFTDRKRARRELKLKGDAEVMLFLGQIRAYKGLETLISAFNKVAPERPRLHLVLAGAGQVDTVLANLDPRLRDRVHVFNRFVDDMEIQLFMRAGDFMVLPYQNILTSGSLLLALSFGLPSIVPSYGMTRTVLGANPSGHSACGMLYPAGAGEAGIVNALNAMLRRRDAGEAASMSEAARKCAETQIWEDISPMLLGSMT